MVSAQDNDEKQSDYEAAGAAMAAAQADVNRLEQLQGFNQIVAPYDGRITARHVDVGALVSAGSGTAGTAIYDLAAIDPLLIYVYVPQSDAPLVHDGGDGEAAGAGVSGGGFSRDGDADGGGDRSDVAHDADGVGDSESGRGRCTRGCMGRSSFRCRMTKAPIMVPANAFVFRTEGAQVALLGDGNKIHWQTISVGRDYGTQLEAVAGLQNGAKLVTNPTDDLQEGMQVTAQEAKPAGAAGPGGAGGK